MWAKAIPHPVSYAKLIKVFQGTNKYVVEHKKS